MRRHTLVETPDASAGLALVARLHAVAPGAHVEPLEHGLWVIADVDLAQLPSALHIVQHWLHDQAIAEVRVRLSEREFRLAA